MINSPFLLFLLMERPAEVSETLEAALKAKDPGSPRWQLRPQRHLPARSAKLVWFLANFDFDQAIPPPWKPGLVI